jgi:hypothetical protein
MIRERLIQKTSIQILLIVQLLPLVIFPAASYSPTSQEWWLPILLAVMVIWADVELLVRKNTALWPWYLLGFSQGFNVISRLMMLMPRITVGVNGVEQFNTVYVLFAVVSCLMSAFILWYAEQPEVRMGLFRE